MRWGEPVSRGQGDGDVCLCPPSMSWIHIRCVRRVVAHNDLRLCLLVNTHQTKSDTGWWRGSRIGRYIMIAENARSSVSNKLRIVLNKSALYQSDCSEATCQTSVIYTAQQGVRLVVVTELGKGRCSIGKGKDPQRIYGTWCRVCNSWSIGMLAAACIRKVWFQEELAWGYHRFHYEFIRTYSSPWSQWLVHWTEDPRLQNP